MNLPSTGVPSLDNDHCAIIEMLDSLTMEEQKESGYTDTMIHILDYCSRHCKEEEDFMKKIGYPDFYFHFMKHREMLNAVKASLHATMSKQISRLDNIANCKVVVVAHIIEVDTLLADYYKKSCEKGL